MSKVRIAVSGTGGGVGQSILKALSETNYEVVALDGDPLGAGLYAAPKSYLIPYASNPDFIDKVLEICEREKCRLFFPGLDAELPILSRSVKRFEDIGTKVIVSAPAVIEISDNKLATYEQLSKHDILVPKTVDMAIRQDNSAPLPFPFILKKREGGARSKDVHVIRNDTDMQSLVDHNVDLGIFVAQEYIEGDEYTCGSINLGGDCKGVIVMRRILRDGDTYKCFAVKNDIIEGEVRRIMNAIKPFGACNVQLRLKDNRPYVFEINARCSGTTGARALCGFNEPKMIADYLSFGTEPYYDIKEQTVLRYWNELVVQNNIVSEIQQQGSLTQEYYTQL